MVEVIYEPNECLALHSSRKYAEEMRDEEETKRKHALYKRDYKHSYRIHLTREELLQISIGEELETRVLEWGSEKLMGKMKLVGVNGQLNGRLKFKGDKDSDELELSGELCTRLKEKGFSEESDNNNDFYFLVVDD